MQSFCAAARGRSQRYLQITDIGEARKATGIELAGQSHPAALIPALPPMNEICDSVMLRVLRRSREDPSNARP